MALIKDITTKYGVSATYHKITRVNIDWLNKIAYITLSCYVSKEARESGKTPISTMDFTYRVIKQTKVITPATFDTVSNGAAIPIPAVTEITETPFQFTPTCDTVGTAYSLLKQEKTFSGCTDDI